MWLLFFPTPFLGPRKKCQLSTDLLVILTALVMVYSKRAKCFEMVLLGRFAYGISAGKKP